MSKRLPEGILNLDEQQLTHKMWGFRQNRAFNFDHNYLVKYAAWKK